MADGPFSTFRRLAGLRESDRFSPQPYWKVRVRLPGGKLRTFWAKQVEKPGSKLSYFKVVEADGEVTNELVVASPTDIVWAKPARMNLKYAELELELEGVDDA